jgi:adenylate kinase
LQENDAPLAANADSGRVSDTNRRRVDKPQRLRADEDATIVGMTSAATRITILGMQGSGKGTQGARLAGRLNVPLISIGPLLRERSFDSDERAELIRVRIEAGALVDEWIVNQTLAERLSDVRARRGFVLDGYPRKLGQDRTLATMLEALSVPTRLELALYLRIDLETALDRIARRLVCEKCHIPTSTDAAREGAPCPRRCGGLVQRRADDTDLGAVTQRIATYLNETAPIVEAYRAEGILTEIDADQPTEDVFNEVISAVHQ